MVYCTNKPYHNSGWKGNKTTKWSNVTCTTLKIFFEVKLTFEMLTVRGQQHSFSTHERVFLWNCQSFWDRKCLDLRGTRTPNLRIHGEFSNLLSYQGHTFAVPCFWTLHWRYRYFLSKVSIWNINCARGTAFIFDTRTGVLVKIDGNWLPTDKKTPQSPPCFFYDNLWKHEHVIAKLQCTDSAKI